MPAIDVKNVPRFLPQICLLFHGATFFVRLLREPPVHPSVPKEVYSWLNRFRRADATTLPYYKEFGYAGIPLPFDIMVIDDKVAVQGFADYPEARAYSSIICHNDAHIARSFRATILAMKSNQYPLTQHIYDL